MKLALNAKKIGISKVKIKLELKWYIRTLKGVGARIA